MTNDQKTLKNSNLFVLIFSLRACVFQNYDSFRGSKASSRFVPSEARQRDYTPMVDELALEHMTQDCSLLKNQLLRLKTLLEVCPAFAERCESIQTSILLNILNASKPRFPHLSSIHSNKSY